MRNLKKISAIFLVVAMMLSLVSFTAFAATEADFTFAIKSSADATTTITQTKAEKTVYIDVFLPAGTYKKAQFSAICAGTVNKDDVVTTAGSVGFIDASKKLNLAWTAQFTVNEGEPVATIPIVLGDITAGEIDLIAAFGSAGDGDSFVDIDGMVDAHFGSVKVTILPSFEAKTANAASATASYEIGTDVVAELAKLPVTVKGANEGEEESGYTATWVCTDADADFTVPGTYTFNGTVSDSQVSEDNAASWEGDLATEPVSVTMTAIAGDVTDVEDVEKVEIRKTETALAAGDITKELPSTLKVAKNGIEDTVDVVWTATPDATFGTVEGATLEVTGALAATSTNSKFTFDNVTVEATVTVIPATIDNASIVIKNNSIYAIPQITITVPAKEIKPDNVVTEGEGENATEVSRTGVNEIKVTLTQESGDPIVLTASALKYNDFTFSGEGDDAVATYTVTGTDALNKLGVESGEDVTISATLNKAELVVGTEDVTDEEGNVTGTKDVTSVGITASKPISGSPAGIKPGASINNNSQNNQTGAGTTTPGTETPGTETPGTETPGTDAPVVEGLFEDVAADHWAAEAIATLKDAGIVGGVTATTFAPDADITRAEFTKMIAGLLKLDATSTEVAFEDCGAEDWFTPYVAAAVEAGLVTGVSETEFAPDATITREQAFTIIGRAIAAAEVNTTLTYADAAEISEYAVPYVTLLTQEGIVGGFADNTVRPQANITRAEAAKVIAGLMGIVVTEEEVTEETTVDQTEEATTEEEAAEEETVEEETVEE